MRDKVRTFCFFIASQPCPRERQNFSKFHFSDFHFSHPVMILWLHKTRRGFLVIQIVQMQWQHSRILSIRYIYIYIFIFGEKVIIFTSKTVQCTFTIQWILLFKSQWNVRQVIMNWYSVNWFFFLRKNGNVEVDEWRRRLAVNWNVAETFLLGGKLNLLWSSVLCTLWKIQWKRVLNIFRSITFRIIKYIRRTFKALIFASGKYWTEVIE